MRDDGRGFDVESVRERSAKGTSLGLIGMEERMALAGGSFELRSAPGQGTVLVATSRFGEGARGRMIRVLLADDHALVRAGITPCCRGCARCRSWPKPRAARRRSSSPTANARTWF